MRCVADSGSPRYLGRIYLCGALLALLAAPLFAQVVTIDTRTGKNTTNQAANTEVDRRYRQITPTHVPLTDSFLDPKTRLELVRVLQAEQGFAMRPIPRGHRGLTLRANGPLEPAGEAYLNMATNNGLSAKPGDRLVLTDLKIERDRILIDVNGGPDPKHRFMRHVSVGAGPSAQTTPVVQDNDAEPVGARITLIFEKHVPELTGTEVKALLAPLISFDVKTPIQAFTDTLPVKLKEAILAHKVLVGMSTEMLLYAKGAPENKSREIVDQMPIEEWIYGHPPATVEFVRVNGNRVIRLEVARLGETPEVFTKDEVSGLLRTDGTPLVAPTGPHVAREGDAERDPNTQAPSAPPTLRQPGEKPTAEEEAARQQGERDSTMKPVHFPKSQPGQNPDDEQPAAPDATQPGQPTQPGQSTQPGQPAQPAPAPSTNTPPR